jgi:hypothetical protein
VSLIVELPDVVVLKDSLLVSVLAVRVVVDMIVAVLVRLK